MALVQDIILAVPSKKFWKTDDQISIAIEELIGSYSAWRSDIEKFEYITLIINYTSIALKRFNDLDVAFWKSVLKFYFDSNIHILIDEKSDEYKILSSYFPYTDTLKDCREIVEQLKDLVQLQKDTNGSVPQILPLSKQLYGQLLDNMASVDQPSEYMSYVDIIKEFKELALAGVSHMISLENVESLATNIDDLSALSDMKLPEQPTESLEYSNNVTTEIDSSLEEEISPIEVEAQQIAQTVYQKTVANTSIADQQLINSSMSQQVNDLHELDALDLSNSNSMYVPSNNAIKATDNVTEETPQSQPEPEGNQTPLENGFTEEDLNYVLPEDRINKAAIDNILAGEFELNQFIDQFQNVETLYCMEAKKHHTYDADYFFKVLTDMMVAFDKKHAQVKADKPYKGQRDLRDLSGWQRAKDNIEKFKKKITQK